MRLIRRCRFELHLLGLLLSVGCILGALWGLLTVHRA